MHRRLLTLAWSSSQGGGTLAIGATARLLSRLTPSPLLNGVLPALATLPLLVPLPQRIRLGYLIQLLSLLLLPLVPVIGALQAGDRPQPDPSTDQGGEALRLEPGGVLQGLLFGGLFALLPLWVRQEAAGNCFDFGLVLTAYGLGRTGAEAWGLRLPPRLPYLLMAAVLVATQWVDGWGAVVLVLFVPLGLLAALADASLAIGMGPAGDLQRNWNRLERSSALGGLMGSLGMGLVAQVIGLAGSLPIQLVAFLGAGALLPLLQRRRR